MLIDWFTVGAQAINFLILVWLLKRFLYGRILRAMDERERNIAAQLEQARTTRDQADREAAALREKTAAFDAQRELLLARAGELAARRHKELVSEARGDVDRRRARWQELLEQEKAAFLQRLRERAARETLVVARRVLTDLAGESLEHRVFDGFLRRLAAGEEVGDGQVLASALREHPAGALVRSAFALDDAERRELAETLRRKLNLEIPLSFETAPDVLCGIELRAGGHKVAWSVASYLDDLESELTAALQTRLAESAPVRAEAKSP